MFCRSASEPLENSATEQRVGSVLSMAPSEASRAEAAPAAHATRFSRRVRHILCRLHPSVYSGDILFFLFGVKDH